MKEDKKEKGIKTGGRVKGSTNIVTGDLRARMLKLTDALEEKILKKDEDGNTDLDKIRPAERVDYYLKLMAFLCPKPVDKDLDDNGLKSDSSRTQSEPDFNEPLLSDASKMGNARSD